MRTDRRGFFLMITGLLLIAAALFLTLSNLREESAADESARSVLDELSARIPAAGEPELRFVLPDGSAVDWPVDADGEPLAWPVDVAGLPLAQFTGADGRTYYWPLNADGTPVWDVSAAANWGHSADGGLLPWIADNAGNVIPWPSTAVGETLTWAEVKAGWNGILDRLLPYLSFVSRPDFVKNPGMEMPVLEVDGRNYIGVLSIPSLELELPIMEDWSYPDLRVAPCRYSGSVYSKDIVIAGHNYERHFGGLKGLAEGDEVRFTDAAGNVFVYSVSLLETLAPTAVTEMQSGGWDLTLFTCTYGGANRVTVRCTMEKYIVAE